MQNSMHTIGGIGIVLLVTAGCAMSIAAGRDSQPEIKPYMLDASGELVRPVNYRTWVYVGTPVTPNDMNNGKAAFPEHHNVYIDPESYSHYLKTGEWREGTILVKELVSVGGKQAASGAGYFQGEFIGLEATIKSAEDFPDEPGNWSYFSFTNQDTLGGDLAMTATAFPSASCNSCHAANADDDFVFTQHYPVLRAAKADGETPENRSQRPKTLGAMMPSNTDNSELSFDQSSRNEIWSSTASTPATIQGLEVPFQQDAILSYLKSFQYRNWEAAETGTHPSRGPHSKYGKPVRTFMNDILSVSMTKENKEHPVGSTAIKEMYNDSEELIGWAVESKTQPNSDNGRGWYWYEVTSTADGTSPIAIGNGVPGCAGCHMDGEDYVLTAWPMQ
jgi:hypothetical protein